MNARRVGTERSVLIIALAKTCHVKASPMPCFLNELTSSGKKNGCSVSWVQTGFISNGRDCLFFSYIDYISEQPK